MSGRHKDMAESLTNAIVGFCVSVGVVWGLRAAGLWDANAIALTAVFFITSALRSYVLRRVFRGLDL